MGLRSAEEEQYVGEKRNTFVAGTFCHFSNNEPSELPNCPDMTQIDIWLNGILLDLNRGKVTDYRKILNLKTGELRRQFIWEIDGIKAEFCFSRFVSKVRKHIFAQRMEITNLGNDLSVELRSGINGQVSNSGSQLFEEGAKALLQGNYLQMSVVSRNPSIFFAFSNTHRFYMQGKSLDCIPCVKMSRRAVHNEYGFVLKKNKTFTMEKLCCIHTGRDVDAKGCSQQQLRDKAIAELTDIEKMGFENLLAESASAWEQVWQTVSLEVVSDHPVDQLALNFARYHLHIMVPEHDERTNIAAKGLSGEGYKGHTFWDTEIFLLPYFSLSYPKIARNLVKYRYIGLSSARKNAKQNGYEGAQYPWESAWPRDGEVTPLLGPADVVTGKQTEILSGKIEHHITADVIYGLKQYLDITGDKDFVHSFGYEMILDTGKFWASRFEWNFEKKRYELNDVIGPDEYREHVNNNAYTNYSAYWNLTLAIKVYNELKASQPKLFTKLDKKIGLPKETTGWERICKYANIIMPNENGIIPQDDTYLIGTTVDITEYKNAPQVAAIFHDFNHEQTKQMQISKQADVMLLLMLHESYFRKDLIYKNWNYYEPRTLHDSSLSYSIHAILAADCGYLYKAYQFFEKARDIDMGLNMHSSDEGIHAAAMGGIWQTVVMGFGGLRILEGELRIQPRLPEQWKSLRYGFYWRNNFVSVEVEKEYFTVIKSGGKNIQFEAYGKEYTLVDSLSIATPKDEGKST